MSKLIHKIVHKIRLFRRKGENVLSILRYYLIYQSGLVKLNFYCPVCKSKVHKWKHFARATGSGVTIEPELRLCPHCNSFERTRHFALYLEQNKVLGPDKKMLHFAPEKGLETSIRQTLKTNLVTTDLYMKGVDRVEDITNMSFNNNEFDIIYCSNVLEHIVDDKAAMSELFRVLKPAGNAIIQVPIKGKVTYEDSSITDPKERYVHFGQADHVRYYGEDIAHRLSQAGFEVRPFYMIEELDSSKSDIQRMNLDKRELIFDCTKK